METGRSVRRACHWLVLHRAEVRRAICDRFYRFEAFVRKPPTFCTSFGANFAQIARLMRDPSLDVQLGSTGKAEMIDHLELQTRKLADSTRFYGEVLNPLGYVRKLDGAVVGYGEGESMDLF